jgi:hypothetical protein
MARPEAQDQAQGDQRMWGEPEPERPAEAAVPEDGEGRGLEDRLTGIQLDDNITAIIRAAVESHGSRPPSPRKLVATLHAYREEGRFGDVRPTDADLQDLLRQAVEAKLLERVRKGFSTIYRLPG